MVCTHFNNLYSKGFYPSVQHHEQMVCTHSSYLVRILIALLFVIQTLLLISDLSMPRATFYRKFIILQWLAADVETLNSNIVCCYGFFLKALHETVCVKVVFCFGR